MSSVSKRASKSTAVHAQEADHDRIPAAKAHAEAPHAGVGFRVLHEPDHDSVYAVLDDHHIDPDRSVSLDDDRTIDYTADGTPAGVEFKRASRGVCLEGVPEAPRIAAELHRLGIRVREPAALERPA